VHHHATLRSHRATKSPVTCLKIETSNHATLPSHRATISAEHDFKLTLTMRTKERERERERESKKHRPPGVIFFCRCGRVLDQKNILLNWFLYAVNIRTNITVEFCATIIRSRFQHQQTTAHWAKYHHIFVYGNQINHIMKVTKQTSR
jgi:hypothetical protein